MNCPNCDYNRIPARARFCPECGKPLSTARLVSTADKIVDYKDFTGRE